MDQHDSEPSMFIKLIKNTEERLDKFFTGTTPLHMAVEKRDVELVRLLVLYHPSWIDVLDSTESTPAQVADRLDDSTEKNKLTANLIKHFVQRPFEAEDKKKIMIWLGMLQHLYLREFNGMILFHRSFFTSYFDHFQIPFSPSPSTKK